MRYVRAPLSDITRNPVARVIFACLLLAASIGGLALITLTDSYVNAGVTYGSGSPDVPLADVNPMGVNLFLEKEVEPDKVVRTLDLARDSGFKWIRQGFSWNDIEINAKGDYTDTRNPGKIVNAWDKYDFIVDQAVAHGMTIMARLDSPPLWARIPGDDTEQYHKGPPNNPNDYGDFAEAVATRYKGKIKYYQIWNEPNLIGEWGGHPVSAYEYVALLKVAHDRIKAVDPDAVIISAALAPTTDDSVRNRSDILFLQDMYDAGGAAYFDVVTTMLYGLGQPPDDRRLDFKRLSFARSVLLHDVMVKNGDTKKPIWISEYAWVSYPDNLQQSLGLDDTQWAEFQARNIWGRSVDEQTQARYLVDGYKRARDEWPWMGVMFVWNLRNPDANPLEPASYFTILNPDFSPRPAYTALQEYSKVVPETPTPQGRPIWNTAGFFLLYAIFGLLSFASFAYVGTGVARWTQAAVNRPRNRVSGEMQEIARNGAAITGMIALYLAFYASNNLILAGLALVGYVAIAIFKPQAALALVAFSIPFFWYPKLLGSQRFPIAETLVLLAFVALVARRTLAFLFPSISPLLTTVPAGEAFRAPARTKPDAIAEVIQSVDLPKAAAPVTRPQPIRSAPITRPHAVLPIEAKTTRPLPMLRPLEEDNDTIPDWPPIPHALIAELAKPIVVNWPETYQRPTRTPKPTEPTPTAAPITAAQPIQTPPPTTRPQSPSRNAEAPVIASLRAWLHQDAFALPALLLLAIGLLSLYTLVNPQFGSDSARSYRWVIIEPILLYFLLTDLINTKRGLLRVFDFFVAAGVFVSFVGLWQAAGSSNTLNVEGVSRVLGVYQHPNNLALYLDRVMPFAACYALFIPWGWRKVLYVLACIPMGVTFLLTFSRGAWVAVILAVVIAITVGVRWPLDWSSQKAPPLFKRWRIAVIIGSLVAVALVALVFPSLPDRIFNPSSGLKRIDIWKSALHMGSDHPIFGIGLDQFLNQYQLKDPYGLKYVYITEEQTAELYTAHPHNIFLDWWLSLGIMGVAVLLWLIIRFYREALLLAKYAAQKGAADPAIRAIIIGLICSMTAFFIHGLVDNSYFLMDLALIFWLSCGALQLCRMLYNETGSR